MSISDSVRFFVTDVDGTLTDGKIYFGLEGELLKAFSVQDGYALSRLLREYGITPIVITGRQSEIVQKRCEELGIETVAQGVNDKKTKLIELVGERNLRCCAYFGDDVIDLECMKAIRDQGGVVGCPGDAIDEVKSTVDYVCLQNAGKGAAREFIEWLLYKKLSRAEVDERIRFAVKTVADLASRQTEDGVHFINSWLSIEVKQVKTQAADELGVESHRLHADIQFVIEGSEAIDVSPISSLRPKSDYCVQTDTAFWYPKTDMTRVVLTKGGCIVLYPGDAHRPCIATGASEETVRLAVAKVALS